MSRVKDLSIVIVNWNTGDLLLECIRSVKETIKNQDYEIFVVDNASTDSSLESVERQHTDLILLKNQKINCTSLPVVLLVPVLMLQLDSKMIPVIQVTCKYIPVMHMLVLKPVAVFFHWYFLLIIRNVCVFKLMVK